MSTELTIWLGGIALLTSAAACGAAQTNASKVELPAEVGELPSNLEDAYRVFATNCSKCHGLERALSAPVTDRGHWERYVARMMRTPSSGISAQEAPGILAFLFWYTDKKNGRLPAKATATPAVSAPAEAPVPDAPTPEVPAPEQTTTVAPQGEGAP
jgi:cytochrome c5